MSKFSEKCKELLVENGSNVYRISKSASLERTTLQRMVTGRRIPNIDFVKTFCKALRLSLSEEQELMRLYKMEVIGEATYKSQESILHLFQHLAELEKSNMQLSRNVIQNGDLVLVSPLAKHPYDTDLLVHYIFQNVLHSEKDSFIYTNLPSESPLLLQYLSHFISKSSGKVLVKQLVFFHSNVADIYVNLEILSQILPLCFLENISYEPCYYYRKFINTDQEYSLYPYYIITPDHVLQLSSDLKRSILHSEQQLVQHYQEEFEHIMVHSSPLIYKPDSMEAAMEKYFGSTPPAKFLRWNPPCVILIFFQRICCSSWHRNTFLPPHPFRKITQTWWHSSFVPHSGVPFLPDRAPKFFVKQVWEVAPVDFYFPHWILPFASKLCSIFFLPIRTVKRPC